MELESEKFAQEESMSFWKKQKQKVWF